ncbi:MAG: SRPBCC family protein [Thermoflexales bacterium]
MYHTEMSVTINRPIATVFALVSDLNRFTEWQAGLIAANWTSAGAPGAGSTYTFVTRFAGMRMELPGEVTSWSSPTGWTWRAVGGPFPMQGGYRLEQAGPGTRITMFSDSEPKGWMNVMRPLLKWMGERTYTKSLTRLKAILGSPQE